MKILHVIAGARFGGAETFSMDLVAGLHRAGLTQHVVTRDFPERTKRLRDLGVSFDTLRFGGALDWTTRPKLKKIADRFAPDLVQSYMGRAAKFHTKRACPHIGWYGGYYDIKRFRTADHHVGVTFDVARHIREQGIAPDKVHTIHTFADLDVNAAPLKRSDFETPDDAPLFCVLARLHWTKALDTLLDAFAQVPDAYLWIAGDGEDETKLKQQCTDLGLNDRVRFLGWQNDRAAVLKAGDFCVFPSRYESFGTVMVEAWACRRPIVAARAQGPGAYIKDGENGLLVDVDDAPALADAMRRLMAEPELCTKLVAGGEKTYQTDFTEQAVVAAYLDLYRKIST